MSYEEEGKELIASELTLKLKKLELDHEFRMVKAKKAFINPNSPRDWGALTAVIAALAIFFTFIITHGATR